LSSRASELSEKAPVAYSRKIVATIGARSGSGSTQTRATFPLGRISRRRTYPAGTGPTSSPHATFVASASRILLAHGSALFPGDELHDSCRRDGLRASRQILTAKLTA
jgi:hypothetical protein